MSKGIPGYFDGKNKVCGNCFEILPLKKFHKQDPLLDGTMSAHWRSKCKRCRAAVTFRYQLEQKLKFFPSLYWECDECDHISSSKKKNCNKCGAIREQNNT